MDPFSTDQWESLRTLTSKICKVLNKAQLQFDERNYKLESGYISDLRQYCRIVTVCEEQLILSLVEYELKFLGELIKQISGFHLLILSHLLNWVQQFEFYLTPQEKGTPFEHLLEQTLKHRNKFIGFKESQATSYINELNDSIQNLAFTNRKIIETYPQKEQETTNRIEVIQDETDKIKENLRSNSRTNTRIIIQKLLSKQKNKPRQETASQTDIDQQKIIQIESSAKELQELIEQTKHSYEQKVKEYKIKYQDAKLVLVGQKCELEHKNALLEAQNLIIRKLTSKTSTQPQTLSSPSHSHFIQIPTFAQKNKKLTQSHIDLLNKTKDEGKPISQPETIFQNLKLRSTSLPRITPAQDCQMRKSLTKLTIQINKSVVPNQDTTELFQRYLTSVLFRSQFLKACQAKNLLIPAILSTEQDDEPHQELKLLAFSKLLVVLKEKHQFCGPGCDHLGFLN